MERIEEILDDVKTMGIGGHVRPDGDCVGSCMALYLYIKKWYPKIHADIYLEKPKPVFGHIACMDEVKYEAGEEKEYVLTWLGSLLAGYFIREAEETVSTMLL